MMREHFGAAAETLQLHLAGDALRHRRRHSHGDSAGADRLRRLERHAHRAGRSAQHRAPRRSCWSIPTASWSIGTAAASSTRARGLVHETWEAFARRHAFRATGQHRLRDPRQPPVRYRRLWSARSGRRCRRIRPQRSKSLRRRSGSCRQSARDGRGIQRGCNRQSAQFDATRCDGLAASAIVAPPKSNWARAITKPPFLA